MSPRTSPRHRRPAPCPACGGTIIHRWGASPLLDDTSTGLHFICPACGIDLIMGCVPRRGRGRIRKRDGRDGILAAATAAWNRTVNDRRKRDMLLDRMRRAARGETA
ncbi:hypothetical protein Uis1B_2218 [Bifidobacterium margollesii]|uniref:Uncharacterized protein n=1 Tax=Bifidobacterium margollesii TaxID=2020964 RepID=A0A2N5J6W2_9BIFI|nr:hypothetical protein [Bifidobacterium margollesii]PLS29950.1 hypothetical protein Uis1B_2218 [Bifidobacterium margollesii]